MNVTWNISDENNTYYDAKYDVSNLAVVSALVVVVWTLLANSTIVLCFIIHRKKIWPSFSIHVLFLSVTDMFVGLASLPFTIIPFLSNTLNYRYCSLLFLIFYASQCASLYQIFGICVHRCITINKASSINEQRSDFRFPVALVFSSWILSIMVNTLLRFLYGSPEVEIKQCQFTEIFTGNARQAAKFLFIVYFVPFILTNILYMTTCLRLRYIWKKVAPTPVIEMDASPNRIPRVTVSGALNQENNTSSTSSDNRTRLRVQLKVVRTIGFLMLIFNICTIPLIAMFVIASPDPSQVNRTFNFIVTTMFILNSAINPFVYALRTTWIKLALKQMFRDGFKTICQCERPE